ncbi:MAG: FAD binding domain-containing protein [Ilumatobacteraceae bacterium]
MLVDIGRLSDLSYIRDAGDHIAIGAMTRHMDIEKSPVLAEHVPLLAHAAGHVGDPQVRHRGTIGGSIAHSDAASDLPATTLALGATYVAQARMAPARSPQRTSSRASSPRRWPPTRC